jgi:hypothetical protein
VAFLSGPQRFWSNEVYFQDYMEALRVRLGYDELDDWHNLTVKHVISFHGRALMANQFRNSPIRLLRRYRPDYPWEPDRFQPETRKTQRAIFHLVEKWFGKRRVDWNYKHAGVRFKRSGYPMESDVFVPHLSLAIEYQGESHFIAIDKFGGQQVLDEVIARDMEKRAAFKANKIILVEIDYHWDRHVDSLRKAIREALIAAGKPMPDSLGE